jgi:hypothetical protein
MRITVLVVSAVSCTTWNSLGFAQETQQLPALTVTTTPSNPKAKKATAPPAKSKSTGAPALQLDSATKSQTTGVDALDPRLGNIGAAQTSSEGFVPAEQLLERPAYRVGEILEAVPGLVVTQHSGDGKANQYFMRGFNLDHGTDIAITMDAMPVNMRTHGHGQGYADTNFVIPEIMRGLSFRKGPYFASEGDFSSAGAVHLDVVDSLEKNFAQLEIGSFGHRRAVTGMSAPVGLDGTIMIAGEAVKFDGPWDRPDDLRKLNSVVRYSNGTYENGFALTAMAYSGHWYATDQIPQRAVDEGFIGRFGYIDPTDGGVSHRYSLSARWHETDANSATRVNAYLVKSDLDLFNNFSYLLNDPVNGDQFQQTDNRTIAGASASTTYFGVLSSGQTLATTVGIQGRYDDIGVGLFNTKDRARLSTVRQDNVREASVGLFAESTVRWTDWIRATVGLRGDMFSADVESGLEANSGDDVDAILSPKFGLVFGPWADTELYLNAGRGFHSNDARGVMTTIDPVSGDLVDRAPFLVRSQGAEVGLRSQPNGIVTSTFSVFVLDFDSEIVFVGDAGTTEASLPSRRIGAEYTLQARLASWMALDLDAAYTRARFRDEDPGAPGRRIPGAIEGVVGAGLSFDNLDGWFGGVNVRYFGARPLIEDNSVRSKSSSPVSGRIGYRFADGFIVRLDGFNLLDQTSSQIDYYYASRLPGENPDGADDIHFHPLEPRSFRLSLTKHW